VERDYGWVVTAVLDIVQGSGPLSPAEVRAYRRRFEREVPAQADDPHRARRLWRLEVAHRPELRVAGHRPPVPVSGLILYVFTAVIAQLLEHVASLPAGEREHFDDASIVGEIVRLGQDARTARGHTRTDLKDHERLEVRVLARLLGLEQKLVRIRLRPAQLRTEIAEARQSGRVDWVNPAQLLSAAAYRKDGTMLAALTKPLGMAGAGDPP